MGWNSRLDDAPVSGLTSCRVTAGRSESRPIMGLDPNETRGYRGCFNKRLEIRYYQKREETTAVQTKNPGTAEPGGSNGWHNCHTPLIIGITGLEWGGIFNLAELHWNRCSGLKWMTRFMGWSEWKYNPGERIMRSLFNSLSTMFSYMEYQLVPAVW